MDAPSWTCSDSGSSTPPEREALSVVALVSGLDRDTSAHLRKVAKSRDFCTLCGVVTESAKSVHMNHMHCTTHSGPIGCQIDLDESMSYPITWDVSLNGIESGNAVSSRR